MRSSDHQPRGMALILALAAVLIISMLLSGALLLSVSHFSVSRRNSDYASALYLAEAGINWELQQVNNNPATAENVWATVRTPATGDPDRPAVGTFQVQVLPIPPNSAPWQPWTPGYLEATGTVRVDGVRDIRRTVRVEMAPNADIGPVGEYALFMINPASSVDLRGTSVINGAVGTEGAVPQVGGNAQINGNVWIFNWAGGTPPVVGSAPVHTMPQSLPWPTVNQLAYQRATGLHALYPATYPAPPSVSVNYFSTHNDNGRIPPPVGGVQTLTAGDYYWPDLTFFGKNTTHVDTSGGPVNVWLGPEATTIDKKGVPGPAGTDTMNAGTSVTAGDVTMFHIYQGSPRSLKFNGHAQMQGCYYAYNTTTINGTTVSYGTIDKVNGTGDIYGSVVAYDMTKFLSGNATISYPGTGGPSTSFPSDSVQPYGLVASWRELRDHPA